MSFEICSRPELEPKAICDYKQTPEKASMYIFMLQDKLQDKKFFSCYDKDMSADKSLFQVRRQLAKIQELKSTEKKKFNPGKFLPIHRVTGIKKFLPKVLVRNKKRTIVSSTLFAIVIVGAGAFGYYQYLLSQNPAFIYAKKLKSMTDIVSQQMSLPTDEQPVVATVTDISKLPKEAFFKNAQNGDKILMYKKDKEAILYRPSTGQVITYAALDFKNVLPSPTQAPAVAGASTSAVFVQPNQTTPAPSYVPQGKILIQPQQ